MMCRLVVPLPLPEYVGIGSDGVRGPRLLLDDLPGHQRPQQRPQRPQHPAAGVVFLFKEGNGKARAFPNLES